MSEFYHTLSTTITKSVELSYLLYTPANYENEPNTRYPVILTLHGSGERGNNLDQLRNIGLPKKVQAWPDCPFIVIAPQCPTDQIWVMHLDALDVILNQVIENYRVDTRRMYLSGFSMGGNGTWYMATAFPDRFAAIAPICGRGTSLSAFARLSRTPTWVFHGAKDDVVLISESERMVTALKKVNPEVRFTVYPDADHDSWTAAYDEMELYEWFLQHTR
jgi:predicted peptidase